MKVCPTCSEVYKDDDINFCLADGTTLLKKKGAKMAKHSHWNDVVAIILAALSVLVFLCLVTSSTDDRSLVSTGAGATTKNWIGFVGANVAAIFSSSFGWTAYLVPVLVGIIAWRVHRSDTLVPRASRAAGFVFFAVSLSGLIALVGGYGAIVGEAAAQSTAHFIGSIGAAILLFAIFVSSILLITNFTLAGFLSNFDFAGEKLKMWFDEWRAKRREALSPEIAAAAKKRVEKRKGKREHTDEAITPTIALAEVEEMAAAAAVGRSEPLFVNQEPTDSIPTVAVAKEPIEPTKVKDVVVEPEAAAAPLEVDGYVLPEPNLLTDIPPSMAHKNSELDEIAALIEQKAKEFNVPGKVMLEFSPGPVVTTFAFKPEAGVKYSRVTGLVDDLSLALKAESIRIDRIPGKAYVGIEVPNVNRETIYLRDVIESDKFSESKSLLTLGLGKTIDGTRYVADLAKMPHLLIAGATGAGKSVGVNTLVMSILYKARPDQVKFLMIDPKRLELGLYAGIPHLIHDIIVEPKKAATAIKSMVREMEKRYKDLAAYHVRNIDGYNTKVAQMNRDGELTEDGEEPKILPYIVIIIDELADLMMVSGKEVEESITRLAQMARAVGIHLVLATQRPSVDVITGLIKANFPSRISFRVSSKVDSRTIIDGNGAEALLGQGDMLFLPPGQSSVTRVHGAFVDEKEIKAVVKFITDQGQTAEYDETITKTDEEREESGAAPGNRDALFYKALEAVVEAKRGSTSLLQRRLRIGYGRAAAILDMMAREGYIGEMDGSTRARPVLAKAYEELQDIADGAMGDEE